MPMKLQFPYFKSIIISLFFLGIFILTGFKANSQSIIQGKIIENDTGLPLPYANVYLKANQNIGTISNLEGRFLLTVSKISRTDSLVISYVGYTTMVIAAMDLRTKFNGIIGLQEEKRILENVVIHSEDTLRKFLTQVFNRIGNNYPQVGILTTGFYRETNWLENEKKFIYFSESIIEFYKPPYNQRKFGPARIVEGAKTELKDRRNYSNVYFYAGIYSPQRFDFVKERMEFINPVHFDKYSYSVEAEVQNNKNRIIIITFKPEIKNALYEGKLFIDSGSKAYIKAEYKLTPFGVKKENFLNTIDLSFQNRNYIVHYKEQNGTWYLDYVIQVALINNKKFDNRIRYTNEFVSTNNEEVDNNPISDKDAIPFQAFYSTQEDKFNNDFWNKEEIIPRTKDLQKTVDLLFKDSAMVKKNAKSLNEVGNNRLLKFITRLSTNVSIADVPLYVNNGNYELTYPNYFSISKNVEHKSSIVAIGFDFKYYPKPNNGIVLKYYGNITSGVKLNTINLLYEKDFRLAGRKKPIYIQPSIGIYFQNLYLNLGESNITSDFQIGRKHFYDRVNVGVGEDRFGIIGAVELVYKFNSRLALMTKATSSIAATGKCKVLIGEVPKSLIEKSAKMNLQQVTLTNNNNSQSASPIGTLRFIPIIEIGLRIGLIK